MNKNSLKSLSRIRAARGNSGNRGFTLLEMMLVVMIIGILLAAAIHYMGGDVDVARSVTIKGDIDGISTQLKTYYALNGFYPTTEQGLQALVTKPDSDPKPTDWHQLLDQIPQDPWHNPYNYECPGKHNTNGFDLYSAGANRKANTGTDVGNWTDTGK